MKERVTMVAKNDRIPISLVVLSAVIMLIGCILFHIGQICTRYFTIRIFLIDLGLLIRKMA